MLGLGRNNHFRAQNFIKISKRDLEISMVKTDRELHAGQRNNAWDSFMKEHEVNVNLRFLFL
jgi:hypothetical protein